MRRLNVDDDDDLGRDWPRDARARLDAVTITLPVPPDTIGGNSRAHWARRYRDSQATMLGAAAELLHVLGRERPEWDGPVAVRIVWRQRMPQWLPDRDNAIARCKPIFDAAQAVGLIVNDRQITAVETEIEVGDAGLIVTFRRLERVLREG